MTTISNINIVVQQGNQARDATQGGAKPQAIDPSQLSAAEQQEKEVDQRASVNESEEPEKLNPDTENQEKLKKEKEKTKSKKKKKKPSEEDPDATGRLLDTIA